MQSLQNLRALAFVERDLIEERAVRFVERRASADVKAVVGFLAPQAVYTVPGDRRLAPCFGRFVGVEAIRHFLAQFHVDYEILNLKVKDVLVDGDRAAVSSSCQIRHRGTGASKAYECCDILHFENGFVVSIFSYVDSLALTMTRASGI